MGLAYRVFRGWIRGSEIGSAIEEEDGVIRFPYMENEAYELYIAYQLYEDGNYTTPGVENKIILLCDKTAVMLQNDFPNNPEITEDYQKSRSESFSVPVPRRRDNEYLVDFWETKLRLLVTSLLSSYRKVTQTHRNAKRLETCNYLFYTFGNKVDLGIKEVEAIVMYFKEKGYIKIVTAHCNFKSDTLLAMKSLNTFAQKNGITYQNTIELFCEYLLQVG